MTDKSDFPPGEWIGIARRAARRYTQRLAVLLEATDPADAHLAAALATIIEEARDLERELDAAGPGAVLSLPDTEAEAWIRRWMPSTFERLGEGPFDRDVAVYLVERITEESTTSFRVLAAGVADPDASAKLLSMARRVAARMRRVQVLPMP